MMNWRKILMFDLGSPFSRRRRQVATQVRDLWFVALFDMLLGKRSVRPPFKPKPLDDTNYSPGRYYQARAGRRWRGPVYWRKQSWHRDLLTVVDLVGCLVKSAAPLTQGLEAAGREENRLNRQLNDRTVGAVATSCIFLAGSLLVGVFFAFVAFDPRDDMAYVAFFGFAAIGVLLSVWIFRRSGRVEAVFLSLRDALAGGAPLSEAMRRQSRFFPRFYADLVEAGEESGCLSECLDQLGQDTLDTITLGRTLFGHVLYLGFVFLTQTLLLTFLCLKVFPVLAEISYEFGGELPMPTRIWVNAIDWVMYNGPQAAILISAAVIVLVAGARLLSRSSTGRYGRAITWPLFSIFLILPGLRGLVVKRNLAVLSFVLEKLLRAGVPLDRALESAGRADLHPAYRAAVSRLRQRVQGGESLTEACDKESGLVPLPKSFRGFVGIGERSGLLPDALARIGGFYRQNVEKQIRIMADSVLPLGVLALGGLTLAAELAFFAPLLSLYGAMSAIW